MYKLHFTFESTVALFRILFSSSAGEICYSIGHAECAVFPEWIYEHAQEEEKMKVKKIAVAGSANMDLVMRVSHFPQPGETLAGKDFSTAHGGKGANQAVAAARLGGQVSFIGAVGNDAFGAQQRQGLAAEGIDLRYLKTDEQGPTGTAIILVADSGENMIILDAGANDAVRPEDISPLGDYFKTMDHLVCQLECPQDTVYEALKLAATAGVFSILDVAPARPLPPEFIAAADLVTPNESEAEILTGIRVDSLESAREAARHILNWGTKHVVIKLGARGSYYLGGEEEHFVPSFEVNAVDTTGAGDAFTAALAVVWGEMPVAEALRFSNAAGALATTRAGAQPSMPSLQEVTSLIDRSK
jgi:ribokinase